MFESKDRSRQARLGKRRRPGLLAVSLLVCLGGFAAQGRALGQARAVWNDQATVRKVAFSPDGKTLASCSSEVAVRLWDVASGKAIVSLPADRLLSGCSLFTFTPDGKGLVASAGRGQHDAEAKLGLNAERAILWDVATRKVQTTFDLPPGVTVEALTPDGKTLIAGTRDKRAILYDLATGKERATIDFDKEARGWCSLIALSPDGKILAVAFESGAVVLWELKKKEASRTIQASEDRGDERIDVMRFSPDGKVIATSASQAKAELWDVATGKHLDTLDVSFSTSHIHEIAYAPDGKSVALVGTGGCPALWDLAAGGERDDFGGPKRGARMVCVAFSPDGKTLAIAVNKTIELWDVPPGRPTGIKPRE